MLYIVYLIRGLGGVLTGVLPSTPQLPCALALATRLAWIRYVLRACFGLPNVLVSSVRGSSQLLQKTSTSPHLLAVYEGESKSKGKIHLTALMEVTVSNFTYHFST